MGADYVQLTPEKIEKLRCHITQCLDDIEEVSTLTAKGLADDIIDALEQIFEFARDAPKK
jgi:hypothetical protein